MTPTSLGYRTDIALLRLGGSITEDHGDHLVVRSPHNPTFWWGNFLLLAGLPEPGTAPEWLHRFAEAFPGAAHVALGLDVTTGSAAQLDEFSALGYAVEVSTVLTATTVEPPAARNRAARCRRLVSDDDWAQSADLTVRSYDGDLAPAGYRDYATARATTNRRLVDGGHGAWFGAFLAGRLVAQLGLVTAGPGLARFQSVGTDPTKRRQGLASALLLEACRTGLGPLGAETLVIVADPEYFAIDLYRSVGFVDAETQLQVERPTTVY